MVRGWWLVYTGKTHFDVCMLVDSGAILKLALLGHRHMYLSFYSGGSKICYISSNPLVHVLIWSCVP